MDETVKIDGLDTLLANLELLPKKVADKDIGMALRAGGKVVQGAFVANAPEHTGFLKEHFNIKVKLRRDAEIGGSAYVGPAGKIDYPDKGGGYRLKVIKNKLRQVGRVSVVSVVRWLEFGRKGVKHPFMTQAFEASKNEASDAMTTTLAVGIIASATELGTK